MKIVSSLDLIQENDDRNQAIINRQAIHLLYQELGAINTVRFPKQFTVSFGDYTKDREVLFGSKTSDRIANEIEQNRKPIIKLLNLRFLPTRSACFARSAWPSLVLSGKIEST
ncbi:MAG: hypothetical protein J7455_18050 [Roseiflexus sp.]|nr:hypothetical protein [Roseiflexus sp.]MBO9390978.1 hypothetical protein [Roseiflexus sp.]